MPTRKTAANAVDIPAPPASPDAGEREDMRDEIADILQTLGASASTYKARVERREGRGEEGLYLGTIDLTPDMLDDVRERWGGGKYRARITTASGAYVRRVAFGIAGPPRDETAPVADDPRLSAIEKTLDVLANAVAKLATAPAAAPAPAVDTLGQFAAMAKILSDLRPAPAPAPAAAQNFTDQIQAFVAVQQMIEAAGGRNAGSDRPALDVAALVKDGLTPLVGVVHKQLDINSRALALKEQAARTAAPPALAPAGDTLPTIGDTVRPLTLTALLGRVPSMARAWLANKADNDLDPSLYADVVLDALPTDTHAELPRLLDGAGVLDETARAVPEWNTPARLAWIASLYREILDRLADNDDIGAGVQVPGTDDAERKSA